jgi:hypothetical protein
MLKSFFLVIPKDIFFSETELVDYMKENDIYDMLNDLSETLEYDSPMTMLYDEEASVDYYEYEDVVVCSYDSCEKLSLQPDGIMIYDEK